LPPGQLVFGLCDWSRDGALAEYAVVEARDLAPLSTDVDHIVAARSANLRADRVAGPV
jgi:NADPH:quinone reductase-like Zn-dependent oxidoreductase